jgi:flagellar basal body-associated protein FliL
MLSKKTDCKTSFLPSAGKREILILKMSDEEEGDPKPRFKYILWIGVLLLVAFVLFTVPLATIGMAFKKIQMFGYTNGQTTPEENTHPEPPKNTNQSTDLANLRATVEKAASNSMPLPKLVADKDGFQIQVVPPATLDSASSKVEDVLRKNHYQFVEAYDHDVIRIIVIIQSSEWPELSRMLSEATDISGFQYRGPSDMTTQTNRSDSTVARIEIMRKPAQ